MKEEDDERPALQSVTGGPWREISGRGNREVVLCKELGRAAGVECLEDIAIRIAPIQR